MKKFFLKYSKPILAIDFHLRGMKLTILHGFRMPFKKIWKLNTKRHFARTHHLQGIQEFTLLEITAFVDPLYLVFYYPSDTH